MRKQDGNAANAGQAMIEFMVGLLVVVVLTAGSLQWIEIASARSDLLGKVRGATGRSAMLGTTAAMSPPFLKTWREGPDERRHTADDEPVSASPAGLQNRIVERSVRNPEDWRWIDETSGDELLALRSGPLPAEAFGLTHGRESRIILLSPAIRALVYDKPELVIAAEVWMPHMGGLR